MTPEIDDRAGGRQRHTDDIGAGLDTETPPNDGAPPPTDGPDEGGRRLGLRELAYAVALLPFVTAAVRALRNDWFPIGDSAQLYLRATDVGTRHHPWLGAWSSLSTSLDVHLNNPGPLYADLIAPFAHLFGPGAGNVLGVSTLNVACLVGAAMAARRIGGERFELWILAAGAGLAWTMGSELLFDMFQAHALLFPFLLLLVLVVGAMHGLAWPWPWLAAVASLILQTHISYAYICVLLAATLVGLVVAETDPPRGRAVALALRSTTARWTAAVVAVLWAQSFGEQLFGEGQGNLARLVANAGGGDISVGLRNATKLTAAIISLPPWWSRPGFADTIEPAGRVTTPDGTGVVIPGLPSGGLAVLALGATVALLAGCLWRAHVRGDRTLATLATVSLAGTFGAVIALSQLSVGVVGLAPHHTRWAYVIGLLAHLTILWTAVEWLVPRLTARTAASAPATDTRVLCAAIVVVLGVANVPMYAQPHGPTDDIHTMPAMRRLFPALDALRGHDPVLYRTDNLRVFEPYSSALQLQLRDRGIEFRVDHEGVVRHLGNSRRADGTERSTLTQLEAWSALTAEGCVLARASALDAGAEAALEARAAELAEHVTGFDVGGVRAAPESTDVDRELADRFADGDGAAIRQVTYDGRLRFWLDRGWVSGPADAVDRLRAEGPEITTWLNSIVALTVTPDDVCDR